MDLNMDADELYSAIFEVEEEPIKRYIGVLILMLWELNGRLVWINGTGWVGLFNPLAGWGRRVE
jgi:hypothetical protein